MYLPRELVGIIVGFADVSIDTKLHFGVNGKLMIDHDLVDALASVNKSKRKLITTGDTTVCKRKFYKGCKRRETSVRINRYTDGDKYVLLKYHYKRSRFTQMVFGPIECFPLQNHKTL